MAANAHPVRTTPRPPWLHIVAAAAVVLLLSVAYLGAMRFAIEYSNPHGHHTPDERDLVYLWLHLGVLAAALVTGFALGRWLRSAGTAYAVLLLVVLATVMVGAQLGSRELACSGHDGLIRHWTC
ncbi:MAG: hypothetical protein IT302_04645 [Dehalococcoidia bacterium]|nr:hypothetical protein [Dehalococcoidia bacterium]